MRGSGARPPGARVGARGVLGLFLLGLLAGVGGALLPVGARANVEQLVESAAEPGAAPITAPDPGDVAPGAAGRAAAAAPADAPPDVPPDAPPPCTSAPLAQRAGQVLVVGLPGVTAVDDPLVEELRDVGVGGVLLTKTNVASEDQVHALVGALRAGAASGVLVTTDEEPGRVSSFGELIGRTSSARTIARRAGVEGARAIGAELGAHLARFGVDLDLAPVADLDDGPAQGVIGDRAFSADPHEAAALSLAFSEGLASAGVGAAVKHFPGHGRSTTDSHRDLAVVDVPVDELRTTDLVPFMAHIAAGAPVVMLNHVGYAALDPDLPASLSPRAYALLRELGFDGVAMTDSVGMGAVNLRWPFPEAAVMAVSAGADAVLATDGNHARAMRDALVAAVEQGRLPEARLDEAVARVLALKGRDPRSLTCTVAVRPAGPLADAVRVD